MTIRYEANPPKILPGINKDESIEKFVEKIKTISKKCDAIHLTENVLGHERVSPLEIGKILKKEIPDHPITVSLRVRDKKEEEIEKFVENCISTNIEGILILMGDPSQSKTQDSGLIPSSVVSNLKKKYESKIDLWISEPDEGIYDAMNKGIGLANGEVIGLLNADDYYESDSLEKIQKKHITDSADIYYGNMIVVKQRTKEMIEKRYPNFKKLYFGMYLNHPATFVKKEV